MESPLCDVPTHTDEMLARETAGYERNPRMESVYVRRRDLLIERTAPLHAEFSVGKSVAYARVLCRDI